MKTASAALEAHNAQAVTTIATCWKITRRDGQIFTYTDHPAPITFEGFTYLASSAYNASTIESSSALNVDNLEISGAIDSATITEADLLAGKWDFAEVRIFEVNYSDLTQGALKLRRGWLGEVRTAGIGFTAELRGMLQAVQQNIGRIVSTRCDARVGDTRCKINLATFTDGRVNGTVTAVTDNRQFTASALTQATSWFDEGVLTWTAGLNAGLDKEIRTFTSGGAFALHNAMPFAVQVGDTFTVEVGCDGSLAACRDKFANVINRRAFDFLPGLNTLMANE